MGINKKTIKIVRRLCNGKRNCILKANNRVFGDACKGVTKYLEVDFKCVKPAKKTTKKVTKKTTKKAKKTTKKTTTKVVCGTNNKKINKRVACEGSGVRLCCKSKNVLQVRRANYGRTNRRTCSRRTLKPIKCINKKTIKIVRRLCNGERNCILKANNRVFGDACKGVTKYLEVDFKCVKPAKKTTKKVTKKTTKKAKKTTKKTTTKVVCGTNNKKINKRVACEGSGV